MEWVFIGTVTKAHGLKGELKFRPEVPDERLLRNLQCIKLAGPDGGEKELRVVSLRGAHSRRIIKFEGLNSIDEVKALAGWTVSVRREDFEKLPEGEFYWFEVEGLKVYDVSGHFYGRIEEIIHTGSNDVYVVRGEGRELLLPKIDSVVKTIDLNEGKLVFHPVEGLLEDTAV